MENKNYLDKNALYNEVVKFQRSAEKKEDRRATEELGKMILTLTEHILKMPSFYRYTKELKEDMAGLCYYKCMKGLQTFKIDAPGAKDKVFSYFSTACVFACYTVLDHHYKELNKMRALRKSYLKQADFLDPRIREDMLQEIENEEEAVAQAKAKTAAKKASRAKQKRALSF